MPKKPAKKTIKFAQKTAPKLKQPNVKSTAKPPQMPVRPAPHSPVVPPQHFVHPAVSQQTEAEKIWDEIRNLPIQMFGLPGQVVAMHAVPFPIEPTKLYLTIRSSATLPSLESALAEGFDKKMCGNYTVEQADRFVIVARKTATLFPPAVR